MTNKYTFKVVYDHKVLFESESAEEAGRYFDQHKDEYDFGLQLMVQTEY